MGNTDRLVGRWLVISGPNGKRYSLVTQETQTFVAYATGGGRDPGIEIRSRDAVQKRIESEEVWVA